MGEPERWPQSLKTIVRVMLDSRYAMWMLWGPELTFFCNDAYLPTVGIKRDWVLGARSDKVWEEIWPEIGPRIQQVLAQGHATWDEALLLFLERSGFVEETYHTFSYSPVYDDQNRIAGMLCVVTEVTERIIGERRLRTLRDLAASSTGVESVQEACDRLLNVSKEDPLDVPFICAYVLDRDQKLARLHAWHGNLPEGLRPNEIRIGDASTPWPLEAAVRGGEALLVDLPAGALAVPAPLWPDRISTAIAWPVQGQGASATMAVLLIGVSPRRAFDESYRGFFELVARQFAAALADAEAYESTRARAEALAEIDRAKTTFFSNVSHEFRTPLTLLLAPIEEILSDPQVPRRVQDQLSLARRNALRLLKLVNSLLDFARIEAGRLQAWYEPIDLSEFTAELASTFRSAIERADLRFEVDCASLGQFVYVDREMWEKIVLNLLSNAFKFTLRGSIVVTLRSDASHAIFEIADTGVGIPEREMPRLFERFHRVDGTHGRTHEGSGIGLALVQELVRLHGGTVAAQSTHGVGSTFQVRLPFGRAHLPADRLRAAGQAGTGGLADSYLDEVLGWLPEAPGLQPVEDGASASHDFPSPRSFSGSRPVVLLADDNADMRRYVRRLLETKYEVVAVNDGEAALRAARERRPDLVLSDVMMPKLDGFGLLRALRSDAHLGSVPVILLSARAGEEASVEGLNAGADDYLSKPFSARELLARVDGVITLTRVRREAAEQLRISEERFRAVQEASPDSFVVLEAVRDPAKAVVDFKWVYVNQAAALLLKRPREWLLGRRMLETHPGVNEEGLFRRFIEVLELGTPWVAELRYARDAIDAMVRLSVARVGDGVAVAAVDLSARWLAEEALRQADRQKDEFLAMLAHELRNPLAPIGNSVDFLSRVLNDDERARSALGMAKRQFRQLTRLVDDLLDVSRITQGRIELQRQPLELAHVVSQALETVEPLVDEKRHEISVTHLGSQPLYVSADAARLTQCLVNVLTNAIKYTNAGGRIRVQTDVQGPNAVIEISDTGAGIAADLIPRVFDIFVQGDRTLDRSQGGLGVGLAVVKRLVEMHGGSVSARSAGPGQGAEFSIHLPLIEPPVESPPLPPAGAVAPLRILVVDDNQDSADSLAMLLQIDGHDVATAYAAKTALQRAQSIKPDIVLLDIGLPEIDGYEVARRLREMPELNGVRLIALTGYGQAEDRRRTRDAGFDGHLVKPVDLAELNQAIAAKASR